MNMFVFAGKNSRDFRMQISNKQILRAAAPDLEEQEVPGRNGTLVFSNGGYKNVVIEYSVFFMLDGIQMEPDMARKIKAWLLSDPGLYRQLYDSYDPGYFRMAYYASGLDIDNPVRRFGRIDLSFTCKPFMYSFLGQQKCTIGKTGTIMNPEGFASNPYIRLTGTGDITLAMTAGEWHFAGVEEYIEIDCEKKITYKGLTPQNNKKQGNGYPELKPGINQIGCKGNVSKIEIVPRWCTL